MKALKITEEIIRENAFEHKKKKPGLRANRPWNNWALEGYDVWPIPIRTINQRFEPSSKDTKCGFFYNFDKSVLFLTFLESTRGLHERITREDYLEGTIRFRAWWFTDLKKLLYPACP